MGTSDEARSIPAGKVRNGLHTTSLQERSVCACACVRVCVCVEDSQNFISSIVTHSEGCICFKSEDLPGFLLHNLIFSAYLILKDFKVSVIFKYSIFEK